MTLDPGYGQTPIPGDELAFLEPSTRELLDEPITRAAVYDLEEAILHRLAADLVESVTAGQLALDEIRSDHFVREVHLRLFGGVWTWAGVYRLREMNIGLAPGEIAAEVRTSLDDIRYRWGQTSDWEPRELGIAVHAELVRSNSQDLWIGVSRDLLLTS